MCVCVCVCVWSVASRSWSAVVPRCGGTRCCLLAFVGVMHVDVWWTSGVFSRSSVCLCVCVCVCVFVVSFL